MLNPLVSVNSNSAPTTVLTTLPAPPNSEVPPRIAAAITVRSVPLSAVGLIAPSRQPNHTPAKPDATLANKHPPSPSEWPTQPVSPTPADSVPPHHKLSAEPVGI